MPDAVNTPFVTELIGDLYEAAAAPDRWPVFLDRLATGVPHGFVLLGVLDRRAQYSRNLGFRGLPDSAARDYRDHFIRLNPWIPDLLSAPLHEPVAVRELTDDTELQRGEFFQDWLRHQPAEHPTSLMAPLDGGRRLCLTVVHHAEPAADDTACETLLRMLAPHFNRAAQLMQFRDKETTRRTADAAVVDMLSMGVIYADMESRVVYANAAAEAIMRAGDGLTLGRDARLTALRPGETEHLRAAIRDAVATSRGLAGGSGGSLRLPRQNGAVAIATLVTPLPHPASGLAVVFLKRLEGVRVDAPALQVLLELTPSEAAVAVLLATGASLPKIAEDRGVSLGTVRNQVKALLSRTGTRSQADLVRSIMRSSFDVH